MTNELFIRRTANEVEEKEDCINNLHELLFIRSPFQLFDEVSLPLRIIDNLHLK